jgi:hypothetical protein
MSGSKSSDEVPISTKSVDDPKPRGIALSAEGAAAVAAVLHLLRLVSAELILFRGLEVGRFEKAMHDKIGEFTSPTTSQQAREAGLAFARVLVDQILVQVRAQAELKKQLGGKSGSEAIPPTAPQSPLLHRQLRATQP